MEEVEIQGETPNDNIKEMELIEGNIKYKCEIKKEKDNKYNTNNINNNQNHNIYYSKYLSNHYLTNYHSNNNYNIHSHLIKNTNSNNANINIKGIKKIIVKPTDNKKVNLNQNKISGKPIPTPCQKKN